MSAKAIWGWMLGSILAMVVLAVSGGALAGPAPDEPRRASPEVPASASQANSVSASKRQGQDPPAETGSVMCMSDGFRRAVRDWRGR